MDQPLANRVARVCRHGCSRDWWYSAFFKKSTNNHRLLGYVWVALILAVSVSSFGIFTIRLVGPFSPIHLLSILTIVSVIQAVLAIRRGDVERHKKTMRNLYILALLLTGAFTLYPGRIMHQVVFG